jgi:hypothetical protein
MPDEDGRINGSANHDHDYSEENYLPGLHFIVFISLARIGAHDGQRHGSYRATKFASEESSVPPDATVEQVCGF